MFSTISGMEKEASTCYSKLAQKIIEKRNYVIFIRIMMNFALLLGTNICIRFSKIITKVRLILVNSISQLALTCSELTIEPQEQGVKYVQS